MTRELNMVEAIRDALETAMAADDRVVLLGQDVGRKGGVFGASRGLVDRFGDRRVLDTPVSEIAIAGAAIGAAMAGLRPVAEFQFADYMHPAWDQVVNQAATIRWRSVGAWDVPVVFRAPCGGGVRGGIYHSQSIEAPYCGVPGIKVVMPATPDDAHGLLLAAIADDDPVVFFEPKRAYRLKPEPVSGDALPIGVARLDRPGEHVTVVTYGYALHTVRAAVADAADAGIDVEVLDLRTLIPLDRDAIATSVRKTGRLLVVHDANRTMGFGAEIAAFAAEELFYDLDAPVARVAADDCHLAYGAEEAAVLPDATDVLAAITALARQ